MNHPRMIEKMTAFYRGSTHDAAHFLKVYALAAAIGRLEGLPEEEQAVLEAAAIVHDIACPLCREKYGSAPGHLQELESETLLRPFLGEFSLPGEALERIILLVSRHHTWSPSAGRDHQILLEADFLVNMIEGNASPEAIDAFCEKVFRTPEGKQKLDWIRPKGER